MLEWFKGYFHTITILSPTLNSDDSWDRVRTSALLGENKRLKQFLDLHNHAEQVIVEGKHGKNTKFDPHIPESHLLTTYDPSAFQDMMREQSEMIEKIRRLGGSKHLANRWLIIMDDMVGSNLFSGRRDNPFKRFVTSHRHLSASSWQVTQAFKELPKTARLNYTGLIAFDLPNHKELESLYEEFPNGMDQETWVEAFRYCTQGDFGFMYLNIKRPKRLRMMRNFDEYVFIDK